MYADTIVKWTGGLSFNSRCRLNFNYNVLRVTRVTENAYHCHHSQRPQRFVGTIHWYNSSTDVTVGELSVSSGTLDVESKHLVTEASLLTTNAMRNNQLQKTLLHYVSIRPLNNPCKSSPVVDDPSTPVSPSVHPSARLAVRIRLLR